MEALLLNFGSGVLLGGGVAYFLIRNFIPSYLSVKAKNLATKEDIADITHKVESVKTDYAKIVEEIRSNYQLKFATVEREKSIKREVYLDAVEAIVRTQNMISNFSNLDKPEQEITSCLANDAGKIAKVQIVGEPKTVRSITKFMVAVGSATLNLMLERRELMLRKENIETVDRLKAHSQQEIGRFIALMKNLNLEGNSETRLRKTIYTSVEHEKELITEYDDQLNELWAVQRSEHLEFAKSCMDKYFTVSALLPNAILSVREELELEINPEDLISILNESLASAEKVFDEFYHKIKRQND